MQAAVDWTSVLINMNTGNVTASLQRLHDGTVGELNADFDSTMQPYQQVVQRLQSTSRARRDCVMSSSCRSISEITVLSPCSPEDTSVA